MSETEIYAIGTGCVTALACFLAARRAALGPRSERYKVRLELRS